MKEKIEKLIELLQNVDFATFTKTEYGWSGSDDEIENLLCDIVITENGGVNYNAIRILAMYGYHIKPGEKDSFGWVTGVLWFQDKKHFIVFG